MFFSSEKKEIKSILDKFNVLGMGTPLLNILDKVDVSYQSLIGKKCRGIYPVSCFNKLFYIQFEPSVTNNEYIVGMIDSNERYNGLHIIHLKPGENIVTFYYQGNRSNHPYFNPLTVTTIEELLEGLEPETYDIREFPPTDMLCPPPTCPVSPLEKPGHTCPVGTGTFSRRELCATKGYYFPRNGKCALCQSELEDTTLSDCLTCPKISSHYINATCDTYGDLWRDHLPKYERGRVFAGKKTYLNK